VSSIDKTVLIDDYYYNNWICNRGKSVTNFSGEHGTTRHQSSQHIFPSKGEGTAWVFQLCLHIILRILRIGCGIISHGFKSWTVIYKILCFSIYHGQLFNKITHQPVEKIWEKLKLF
jgi:hypothetical protein